ncbi:serine/threonine-protein kinase HAL4/sat4 [Datura stramonium]|uniref:Serine/threonine-protein kinase HAL4/sat4 n=1 Tax=Datura stramonium TaxID=4076 RepID=A0ABS8RPI5_DATST|nr:serine/threonine-protein kinase HAL4/sat4 [Datura stramonium]
MACSCLSDDTWFALSQMRSTTSLTTTLQVEDQDNPENFGPNSAMAEYRLEKVFPVYAVGVSEPDPNLIVSAEKEPILSSFLYHGSILTHDCLERALSFVLSNRLQNPTLLATQLMDIFCDVIMPDRCIQCSTRLDLQACKDRDPSCLSYCSALLYLKGYHSLQTHRVAHALWNQSKVLALALQSRVSEVFGVDIHPAAKIGDGILLDHATGVVIGETAVIGNRVSLMQGVTLGTGKKW